MIDLGNWSYAGAAGLLLLLGSLSGLPGLLMFGLRGGHRGGAPKTHGHYVVERSFILAAAALIAIGFVLLDGVLTNSAGAVLARLGASAYFFAAILVVVAEAVTLASGYDKVHYLTSIYVVMAFLAQALIGAALLQARLTAAWIGWLCVVWNIAWLAVLSLFSRRDMYYPALHFFAPLLIGIALLV